MTTPVSSIKRLGDPVGAVRSRQGHTTGVVTLCVFGDSKSSFGEGYPNYIPVLSKGRIRLQSVFSHPGYDAAGLLPLVGEIVNLNPRPDAVLIDDGTNDSIGNVGRELYIERMRQIILAFRDKGIKPIVMGQPPLGNTGSTILPLQNAACAALCRSLGVPYIDTYSKLVDPATGLYQSAYDSGDHVHPSAAGIAVIAQALVDALLPIAAPAIPAGRASSVANLVTGGQFLVDTNSDGIADGWTLAGSNAAGNLVTDATIGKWQRVTLSGATAPVTLTSSNIFSPLVAPGDKIAVHARVRTGQSGTNTALQATVKFYTSGGGVILPLWVLMGPFGFTQQIADGAIYGEFTAPALTGIMQVIFTYGKSTSSMDGTYDVGAVTVENLSAAGIR